MFNWSNNFHNIHQISHQTSKLRKAFFLFVNQELQTEQLLSKLMNQAQAQSGGGK